MPRNCTNSHQTYVWRARLGRSQDFSEGVSQEHRQQKRRPGVCDAPAHTSSTQMLGSLPGLLPRPPLCAMRKRILMQKSIARAGGGDESLERKCTESSQLTFDRIMLVPRLMLSATPILYCKRAALHHAPDTRPTDPWALPPVLASRNHAFSR